MTRLRIDVALLVICSAITWPTHLSAQGLSKSAKSPDGFALPDGAIHRFGNQQLRHSGGIVSVAVAPDGNLLATVGANSIVIWDLKSLAAKQVLRLRVPQDVERNPGDPGPYQVAFTADSSAIIVIGQIADGIGPNPEVAAAWDIATGKRKFGLKAELDESSAVWITGGGKELAIASGSVVRFYNAINGEELRKTKLAAALGGSIVVAPGGDLIASGFGGERLFIQDARTGKERDFALARVPAQGALSPDGKRFVTVDAEARVHVFDLDATKELFDFVHPSGENFGPMRLSADGMTLFMAGQPGHLYRWDLVKNRRLPDIGRHSAEGLSNIALSPDESILYSVGTDGMVRRWDLKAGKAVPDPDGYVTRTAIALHPDGKHLFVADRAGRIDMWEIATGRHVKRLQDAGKEGINCLAVSTDGRWLACGRTVPEIELWDLDTGKRERVVPAADKSRQGDRQLVERVLFSPDGRTLYTGVDNEGVTAVDVASGKKLWNRPQNGYNLAVDPRGRWIVTGIIFDPPVRVAIVEASTGRLVRGMVIEPSWAEDGEILDPSQTFDRRFTPDGSRAVTIHSDGSARVWNAETGKELIRMKWDHSAPMEPGGLACSADGKWIAVREGRKILIWETASGIKLHTITGHDSVPWEVAFTPNYQGIIANADLAPVLWSLKPKDLPPIDGPADALWQTLESTDGPAVFRLQWALASNSKAAVSLLTAKAKPTAGLMERARFDKLVAALDSPQFRARESAERELVQARHAVPLEWVRQALAKAKSDEQWSRLERVLTQREKPSPEELRFSRAVQVLEFAGTDEAKSLLKSWSTATGSTLAIEAKAALDRIVKP